MAIKTNDRLAANCGASHLTFLIDRENHRQMRMAVQDDRRLGRVEDARCMHLVEHVFILVVRGAVTEKKSVMFQRSQGQLLQESAIGSAEMFARPLRSEPRGVIKAVPLLEACRNPIMIPANVELGSLEGAHRVDDLIGLGAIADEVSEADDAVEFLSTDVAENGAEGLRVRVKIADDKRSHDVLQSILRREAPKDLVALAQARCRSFRLASLGVRINCSRCSSHPFLRQLQKNTLHDR